jgi:Prolyl oligopeptidase family
MPDEKDLLKMRECSPLVYAKNVRAPVLMLIGGKDRRVPMSQGVSYFHNLKAKGEHGKSLELFNNILFGGFTSHAENDLTVYFFILR